MVNREIERRHIEEIVKKADIRSIMSINII